MQNEIDALKAQLAEAENRLAELEAYDANLQRLERERGEAEARADAAEKSQEIAETMYARACELRRDAEAKLEGMRKALEDILEDLDDRQDDGANFNPGLLQCMESARAALDGGKEGE